MKINIMLGKCEFLTASRKASPYVGVPGSPNRASNSERRLRATSRNMNSANGTTHIAPYHTEKQIIFIHIQN